MKRVRIIVEAVAGRRLSVPRGSDYEYTATVSSGEVSATTSAAKCVTDSKLGSSIAFRDRLELEITSEDYDPWLLGVSVELRSTCGTVHFGIAACRSSRKWFPIIPTCGEMLCNFTIEDVSLPSTPVNPNHAVAIAGTGVPTAPVHRPASGLSTTSARRSAALSRSVSAVSAASPTGFGSPVTFDDPAAWAGTLTVSIIDAVGLTIPAARVQLYAVVQFAMMEQRTQVRPSVVIDTGHSVAWNEELVFDILPYTLNKTVTVKVYGNYGEADGAYLGSVTLHISDRRDEDVSSSTMLPVTGQARSRFHIGYHVTYSRPRTDGRPQSAHPSHRRSNGSNGRPSTASKLRTTVTAGRQCWGEPEEDANGHGPEQGALRDDGTRTTGEDAQETSGFSSVTSGPSALSVASTALLAKLERRIGDVVTSCVGQIVSKLNSLEVRVARTEEMLSHMHSRDSTREGGRAGPAPSTIGATSAATTTTKQMKSSSARPSSANAASRPSSADSIGGYDVSQSIVTEGQLRATFKQYDTAGRGYLTKAQLVHFYRKASLFGADESEQTIVRFLKKYCPNLQDDLVTFDEFTQVSLKLAQL